MVRYISEQRVFLYDSYVKYGSDRKYLWKFRRKFHDEIIPSRQTIHNLVNQLRTTGLLIDKKQKHKRRVLSEEKLGTIGARLEHTPRKLLNGPAQETGVSKSSERTATQLLKPSSESWCLVCCKCKRDDCTCVFNATINWKKLSTCREDCIFNTSFDL
jgi:transposase